MTLTNNHLITLITAIATLLTTPLSQQALAQMRITLENGQIKVEGMRYIHDEKKFKPLTDSLDKAIYENPNDTTALFNRAVLYLYFNDIMAKPFQRTAGALENLKKGTVLAQQAQKLNMKDFRLKVAIAELYKEMAYRFTSDEYWQFSKDVINNRRSQFNKFKTLANLCYEELARQDSANAVDYRKQMVTNYYPVKE